MFSNIGGIMIQSMTGYGRGIYNDDTIKITVELKSVNHRYLDLSIKLPKKLSFLETDIRSYLKSNIGRGKLDVYVSLEEEHGDSFKLTYNKDIAAKYMEKLNEMSKDFGLENNVRITDLSKYPDVFETSEDETDEDELKDKLMSAVETAVAGYKESRRVEGENLREDLYGKLDELKGYVDFITTRSPQIIDEYKAKLAQRVKDLLDETGAPADESRFAMEVTAYADKVCVDEEVVRLGSHISHMRDVLASGTDIGKKLDFIAQEMNRESNTILSKCSNIEISDMGINLKTVIEKIREQIQNLE